MGDENNKPLTVQDVLNSFNDYQKNLFNILVTVCNGASSYSMLNYEQTDMVLATFALTMLELKKWIL